MGMFMLPGAQPAWRERMAWGIRETATAPDWTRAAMSLFAFGTLLLIPLAKAFLTPWLRAIGWI